MPFQAGARAKSARTDASSCQKGNGAKEGAAANASSRKEAEEQPGDAKEAPAKGVEAELCDREATPQPRNNTSLLPRWG